MSFRVSFLRKFVGGLILPAQFPQVPTSEVVVLVREIHRYDFDFAIRFTPPPALLPSLHGGTAFEPRLKMSEDRAQQRNTQTARTDNLGDVVRPPFSLSWGKSSGAGEGGARPLAPEDHSPGARPGFPSGDGKRGAGGAPPSWGTCAALFYPFVRGAHEGHGGGREEEQVRDTFVLALKLSGTEAILRGVVGAPAYAALVSPVLAAEARVVSLCADRRALVQGAASRAGLAREDAPVWLAHTLLSADEENRVRWLWEEMDDLGACYARAPTLRGLLVLWHVASSSEKGGGLRPSCCPSALDVAQAYRRMRDRFTEMTLCDLAALGIFGAADSRVRKEALADFLERVHPNQAEAAATDARDCASKSDDLGRILVVLFLLKYMGKHSGIECDSSPVLSALNNAEENSEVVFSLLNIASQISASKEKLTERLIQSGNRQTTTGSDPSLSIHRPTAHETSSDVNVGDIYQSTLLSIMGYFLSRVELAAAQCDIPITSPHLFGVTLWLLREMPNSDACCRHFRRIAEHSPADALHLLEKTALLSDSNLNLRTVVEVLLPLLDHCEKEDFLNTVMQEVIISLEHRLRHDPTSFTQDDMKWLSMLGTSLFPKDGNEAVIGANFLDRGIREQMEELNVMDGSPWALCVATYRSLKEIVRALTRDQRSLRRQVQEQMRAIAKVAGRPQTGLTTTWAQDPHREATGSSSPSSATEEEQLDRSEETSGDASKHGKDNTTPKQRVLEVSASVRHRFLLFLEKLVKNLVEVRSNNTGQPIVVSSEMFDFVNQNVPVPNIQDEYRRKIFLLMNVTVNEKTMRERGRNCEKEARGKKKAKPPTECAGESVNDDAAEVIPAELRFLVNSLPLVLSPWASVMVLREVLAESPGGNPRYTYVLNAAIDLQLPISTTRSRIATTLNMWRFLNTQTHKLSLKESVMVKQRCLLNLPFSYILSSYWSLLTWLVLVSLIVLNIVGLDVESQLVANKLFQEFAPWDEVAMGKPDPWCEEAAEDLTLEYADSFKPDRTLRGSLSLLSSDKILSSASYLFLGSPDQWRPMTIVPIGSDPTLKAEVRSAEEYACAMAVVKKMSSSVVFPFYIDLPRVMPVTYLEAQVAERIRRVSLRNAWFLLRTLIRTFPLGREQMERTLITHTCAQANLIQRRITFLVYVQDNVPITEQFLKGLSGSLLSQNANLVLVVHESSLLKGGATPARLHALTSNMSVDQDMHKDTEAHVGNGFERKKKGLQVLPCSRQLHKLRHGALCDERNAHVHLSSFAMQFGLENQRADLRARAEGKTGELQGGTVLEAFGKRTAIAARHLMKIFRTKQLEHTVAVSGDAVNRIGVYKSECTPPNPALPPPIVKYLILARHLERRICYRVLVQWKNYVKQIQKPLLLVPQSGLPLCSSATGSMERI